MAVERGGGASPVKQRLGSDLHNQVLCQSIAGLLAGEVEACLTSISKFSLQERNSAICGRPRGQCYVEDLRAHHAAHRAFIN